MDFIRGTEGKYSVEPVSYDVRSVHIDRLGIRDEGGVTMPKGNPTPQSVATRKYEAKAGYVSKSYKLKKETVEEFAQACELAGVSQAGQLTKMMSEFAQSVNGKE